MLKKTTAFTIELVEAASSRALSSVSLWRYRNHDLPAMKPLSIDKTLRVRLHNADCLTSTENNTLTRYVVLNSSTGCYFPVIQICTGRCPLSAAPPSSRWMQWMYLDSALNYCSARTTINNYLVRWCLLLFHFSLEANVCAHLVPEILRTYIKHWGPAQIPALCWFIIMFCSVHFGILHFSPSPPF